ncbi:YARHG domain-containing protein [Verrucomicrobiales bacterium]|nr:YARHG domain-containing protein [Verrucomicrobiales bacterium]
MLNSADRTIFYLGIFCDGYEGELGAINSGVTADQLFMKSVFDSHYSEASWGVKLDRTTLDKEIATREEVAARIREIGAQIGPEDTVYVHFSGHGVIPDPERGEQFLMDVNEELFSREELAETLRGFSCGLRILVTDCCSTYPESFAVAEGDDPVEPWMNLYSLLVEHTGFVNITAASPGKPAYGTQYGGFLTINLQSDMQRFSTWTEVFAATKERVASETDEMIRSERGATKNINGGPSFLVKIDTRAAMQNGGGLEQLVQRPVAYDLGTPTRRKLPDRLSYVLPHSQTELLTPQDLEKLDRQQLYLARNEIFARHGYDFNSPVLRDHFSSMSWYNVKAGFKSPSLSDVEDRNLQMIKNAEAQMGGVFLTGGGENHRITHSRVTDRNAAFQGVFPHSSRDVIPRSSVQALSLVELSIARNEIYARNGYSFSNATLRAYFAKMPGYRGVTSGEPSFNAVEKNNLWMIRKIERIKGGSYKW